jgi:serine/threonine protein kinase
LWAYSTAWIGTKSSGYALLNDYWSVALIILILGCPDTLTAQITYQTLMGVSYCHKQGCLHRDIKPENILLTAQGQVKL